MSGGFWWLNQVRLYSLYKILYPKRRIYSYSILGTIVSPNKILLLSFRPWGYFEGMMGLGFRPAHRTSSAGTANNVQFSIPTCEGV